MENEKVLKRHYLDCESGEIVDVCEDDFSVITVSQYNVLAQSLVNRRLKHHYVSKKHGSWKYRRQNLVKDIECLCSDVICFEELDHYDDFWKKMLFSLGYGCVYDRPVKIENGVERVSPWGICTCYKRSRFRLLRREIVCFHHLDDSSFCGASVSCLEDRESLMSQHTGVVCVLLDLKNPGVVVVTGNVHLLWRWRFGWLKFRHLILLQQKMLDQVRSVWKEEEEGGGVKCVVPILLGDLNISPNDMPYALWTNAGQIREEEHRNKIEEDPLFQTPEYIYERFFPEVSPEEREKMEQERRERKTQMLEMYLKECPVWRSVYADYRTIDPGNEKNDRKDDYRNEPGYTTFIPGYQSTLDYIFIQKKEKNVKVQSVLEIPKLQKEWKCGPLPNAKFSSDHFSISVKLKLQID